MKVKEEYSSDFKDIKQDILREKGKLSLIEVHKEGRHPYSDFLIYDKEINLSYIRILIPNPEKKELYKTFYLKYQIGMKRFLKDFFDVIIGEKEDVRTMYKAKQTDGLSYSVEDSNVIIKLEDGYVLGIVSFLDKDRKRDIELNSKIAEKIIKYFEGETISFSEEVKLCEQ